MEVKLVVIGGDAKPAEIDLKLPATLGRSREATLSLPHSLVSRQHCEIYESDGELMVRDLGSLNGTFIGSERVTEALLPAGGLLTVGTVTFRALYGDPDQVQEWLVEESAAGPEELETFAPVSGETLRDAAPDDQDDSVEEFEDIEVIEDSAELAGPAEVVDVEDASGEENEPQVVDVEDASGEENEPQVPDGEDEADVVDAAEVDDTKQDTDDENDDNALNQFFQQLE